MRYSNQLTVLGLFLLTTFFSCQDSSSVTTSTTIPGLLSRSEKIQLGKEWDQVQNQYAKQIRLIAQSNRSHEAYLTLAEIFIREARITGEHGHYYPAAIKMADQVLEGEITRDLRFRALVTKAGIQLSLHEFKAALTTAEEALALNTSNAQLYGVLTDCYVELGDYDQAIKMADKMMSIKPDIRSYSRISYLRQIHGDLTGAIEAMTLAAKAGYPGFEETSWALLTLGELYVLSGDLSQAKMVYESILTERKDYPFAVSALADIAMQQGDIRTSEMLTREAMDIIPEVGYYVQLAHILKQENRVEEFDKLVEEIFVMLEDDVQSGHNMNLEYADIYLHLLDNPSRSLEFALLEYKKRPKNIDVNKQLGEIYLAQLDLEKAEAHINKASIPDADYTPDIITLRRALADSKKLLSVI